MNLINYIKGRAAGDAALAETEKSVAELCKRVSAVEAGQVISAIAFVTLAEAGQIDDVTAGEHADVFAPWKSDVSYAAGDLRSYDDGVGLALYRCVQEHTSQDGWTPDVSVSLWVRVADPAEEWPEWVQPTGAHDAYKAGDKVSHGGKHWVSIVDNNVWEPGVYGWTEII